MKCPQCPYYEQKTSYGVELIKCNNKCGKAETMTNEQAIKVLNMVEAHGSLVIQAKEMAIKALEQEPCGKDINVPATDAISRQAVLDKLNRLIEVERLQGTDEMGYGRERVSAYECMIHAVESEYLYPTIQPQPKTGHWIETGAEELPFGATIPELTCSTCGWSNGLIIPRNYCPKCGTKMAESEGEK